MTPNKAHPDILWIQIVSKKLTTYVGVVYSRPKDLENHQSIMNTLETIANNILQLQGR